VAFGGDSFVEGETGTLYPGNGMSMQVGQLLGWNLHSIGVGSTGLLNPGSSPRVNYQSRVADWTGISNLALGVVMLSINDFGVPIQSLAWSGAPTTYSGVYSASYAAMVNFIQQYQTNVPGIPLVVIGPTWTSGALPPQPMYIYRDACREACEAFTGVYFMDQYLDTLLTGTGNISAPTGSGNSDFYVNLDGTHPFGPGHEYRGAVLAQKLRVLIQTQL
jgi:hypothetical protein